MRVIRTRSRYCGAALTITLVLGAVLAAPSANATTVPSGGSVVIAVTTEPSTLDAQLVNDRNSRVVTGNIYEALLARDEAGQVVPKLAESYENTTDSTWTFHLRDGVTFHDGTTFDADDVVFSIERMISEDFDTQRTSYIDRIVGATASDPQTVVVETDGTLATLPAQMTQIPIVNEESAATLDTEPVGTGPYRFVSWDPGVSVTAERYEDYWGEAPAIDEFTVRFIADNQTALSALQAGEVDLVIDILPEQRDQAPVAASVPAAEFSYIAFNTYHPALSDPRVRVAFNMAIDKDLLAETVYLGEAAPNHAQNLSEGMLGYNPDLEPIAYDPEGARALLEEAGYPFDETLELNVPIGRYLKGEESVEFVAAQLADIGVNTEIIATDFNTYRDVGRIPGTEEGAMDLKYGWNSNEFFDGGRILSHITCDGPSSKICIPEVDELMELGATSLDPAVREKAYQDVWAILHDNPYAIYLLQQNLLYGMSERLNWEPRLDDEYYVSTMSVDG
jgi:peptide/nickel transport system substrate-binding protein